MHQVHWRQVLVRRGLGWGQEMNRKGGRTTKALGIIRGYGIHVEEKLPVPRPGIRIHLFLRIGSPRNAKVFINRTCSRQLPLLYLFICSAKGQSIMALALVPKRP